MHRRSVIPLPIRRFTMHLTLPLQLLFNIQILAAHLVDSATGFGMAIISSLLHMLTSSMIRIYIVLIRRRLPVPVVGVFFS
jgi:hypothetical protein